ncbi:MAG: redox-sensing transcriptional repressor Rex [Gemmatimonadota bacterium]
MKRIADSTVRRLSVYLRFLEEATAAGAKTISSDELAGQGGTTSAQVRKDLSFFGSFGKRGLGYSVPELTASIRDILGLGRDWRVVIIGAGKIGTALAQYRGFGARRFHVVAIYDIDRVKIGQALNGHEVRSLSQLSSDMDREPSDIAVLTVPATQAQAAADHLVKVGFKAILNFAPTQVNVPDDVAVRAVNMALELEALSFELSNRER